MPKNVIFIAIFVVVVGAVCWSFLTNTELEDLDDLDTTIEAEDDSQVRRTRTRERQRSDDPLPQRPILKAPDELRFESADGLDGSNSTALNVLTLDGREPVTSGHISVIAQEKYDDLGGLVLAQYGHAAFFATHGTHFLLNADGVARVPDTLAPCIIFATTNAGVGQATIKSPAPKEENLLVAPFGRLRLRVVDSKGDPAPNIEVAIGETDRPLDPDSLLIDFARAVTDQVGRTTIKVPLEQIQSRDRDDSIVSTFVHIRSALFPSLREKINPWQLSEEEILFRLPPVASQTFEFVDPDGKRITSRLRVSFSKNHPLDGVSNLGLADSPIIQRYTEDGLIHFPAVTCGVDLKLVIAPVDTPRLRRMKFASTPKNPGETASQKVVCELSRPHFFGRLIDPQGRPLANRKIQLSIKPNPTGTVTQTYHLKSDDQGVFRTIGAGGYLKKAREGFRILKVAAVRSINGPAFAGFQKITGNALTANFDLGDIQMFEVKDVVTGRVVDFEGEPIHGASLFLTRGYGRNSFSGKLQWEVFGPRQTDRNGGFVFHGVTNATELSLEVRKKGFRNKRASMPFGARDVVVTMVSDGGVRGKVLMSDGKSGHGLQARLVAANGAGRQDVRLSRDGSFSESPIAPGNYTFEVLDPVRSTKKLLRVPVVVTERQDTDVGELRVPFKGNLFNLKMVRPKAAKRGLLVIMKDSQSGTELTRRVLTRFDEAVFLDVDVCDVDLVAAGYRSKTMRNVRSGDVPIKMDFGIKVEFQIANDKAIPPGTFVQLWVDPKLGVGLYWMKGALRGVPQFFHAPDRYAVSATLMKSGDATKSAKVKLSPGTIDVLDKSTTQMFRLYLDEDEVKAAAQKLR